VKAGAAPGIVVAVSWPGHRYIYGTGHLGDGATASVFALHAVHYPFRLDIAPCYVAPTLEQPFRLALSERGPPSLSRLS